MVARGFRGTLGLLWLIPAKVVVAVIREALVGFESFSIGQRVFIVPSCCLCMLTLLLAGAKS